MRRLNAYRPCVVSMLLLAAAGCGDGARLDSVPVEVQLRQADLVIAEAAERRAGGVYVDASGYSVMTSELCPAADRYDLNAGVEYVRPAGVWPEIATSFYATAEGTVRCVMYTYDVEGSRIGSFERVFERVGEALTAELGAPRRFDEEPFRLRYDPGGRVYQRREAWWLGGGTGAYLFLLFAPSGTRRVRLTVWWEP